MSHPDLDMGPTVLSQPCYPDGLRAVAFPPAVGDGEPAEKEDAAGEGALLHEHRCLQGADGRQGPGQCQDGRLQVGSAEHSRYTEESGNHRGTASPQENTGGYIPYVVLM